LRNDASAARRGLLDKNVGVVVLSIRKYGTVTSSILREMPKLLL
jgi:hypothetical protein